MILNNNWLFFCQLFFFFFLSFSGDHTFSPNTMAVPLFPLLLSVITSPHQISRHSVLPDPSTFTYPAQPTHRLFSSPLGPFTPPASGSRKWRTPLLKANRWMLMSFLSPLKLWHVNLWVRECWTSWSITTTASGCWESIRRLLDAWCGGCCMDNSSPAGSGGGYVLGNLHMQRLC